MHIARFVLSRSKDVEKATVACGHGVALMFWNNKFCVIDTEEPKAMLDGPALYISYQEARILSCEIENEEFLGFFLKFLILPTLSSNEFLDMKAEVAELYEDSIPVDFNDGIQAALASAKIGDDDVLIIEASAGSLVLFRTDFLEKFSATDGVYVASCPLELYWGNSRIDLYEENGGFAFFYAEAGEDMWPYRGMAGNTDIEELIKQVKKALEFKRDTMGKIITQKGIENG